MAEDNGKEEEKFDFTPEGEGYISLDEARVLALRATNETPGDYGSQYQGTTMVFAVVESTETDDNYIILLSVRPQGEFSGTPGQEQFFIGKEGSIAFRQVLNLPSADTRTASQHIEVRTPQYTEQSDIEQFAEGLGDIAGGAKEFSIGLLQLLWALMFLLAPLRWLFSQPIHLVKWCFRNEAVRDTAHSEATTSIPATNRLRSIPIKIASAIVGLWAGFLWLATILVGLTLTDETHSAMWLYLGGAIASTVAVVLMSKMNKPKANALVVEDKFRVGPLIRLILIGVLIIGSVISFVVIAASLD